MPLPDINHENVNRATRMFLIPKTFEIKNTYIIPVSGEIRDTVFTLRSTSKVFKIKKGKHKGKYAYRRILHGGLDIKIPTGTPIRATFHGRVMKAGQGKPKMVNGKRNVGDIHCFISHIGGFESRYHHLSKLYVRNGDIVSKGQVIGLSGNTGFSKAPHLHFELLFKGKQTEIFNVNGLPRAKKGEMWI